MAEAINFSRLARMPLKRRAAGNGRGPCKLLTSNPHQPGKGSYPQAAELPWEWGGAEICARSAGAEWSVMSNRSLVAADTVIPLAPKSNVKPEAGDPLDRAAQAILGLVHRTANDAKAKNQQTLAVTHQLSAQLRAAEDRIRELEANVRHHQDRADRAERWLYQISVEIEQLFFGRDDSRPSQPPPPQALFRK